MNNKKKCGKRSIAFAGSVVAFFLLVIAVVICKLFLGDVSSVITSLFVKALRCFIGAIIVVITIPYIKDVAEYIAKGYFSWRNEQRTIDEDLSNVRLSGFRLRDLRARHSPVNTEDKYLGHQFMLTFSLDDLKPCYQIKKIGASWHRCDDETGIDKPIPNWMFEPSRIGNTNKVSCYFDEFSEIKSGVPEDTITYFCYLDQYAFDTTPIKQKQRWLNLQLQVYSVYGFHTHHAEYQCKVEFINKTSDECINLELIDCKVDIKSGSRRLFRWKQTE
jgi:hypothetical protein